jgi:uncharacterized protein with HEPN domain
MAEASKRDAALMLDIVLAARDAVGFVADLDEASFGRSRLHQNAVIRSLEGIGEAAGKVPRATQEAPRNSLARDDKHAPQAHSWLRGC